MDAHRTGWLPERLQRLLEPLPFGRQLNSGPGDDYRPDAGPAVANDHGAARRHGFQHDKPIAGLPAADGIPGNAIFGLHWNAILGL
jgi:hypothetical protein